MNNDKHTYNSKLKKYIIKLPKQAKFEIESFNDMLKNLSRILKNIPFSFSLNMKEKIIYFEFEIREDFSESIQNQLYTTYPQIEIIENTEKIQFQYNKCAKTTPILKYGDYFPFLDFNNQKGSFISNIVSQLNRLSNQDIFQIKLKIKPIDNEKLLFNMKRAGGLAIQNAKDKLNIIGRMFSKKMSGEIRVKAEKEANKKNKEPLFLTEISIVLQSDNYSLAYAKLNPIAQTFSKLESEYNEFKCSTNELSHSELNHIQSKHFSNKAMHLTSEEISTVYHFPEDTGLIPNLFKVLSAKAEPPIGLPTKDNTTEDQLCLFAQTNYRNSNQEFGIKRQDRSRHMYVIGKSGSGKSKLLELLIKSDILKNQGLCVIDPHGDLIENIIPLIPKNRIQDTIYFNASDEKYPISFNPIEKVEKKFRQQIASGFIEIFKKSFGVDWTPRIEHVLRMSVLALLDAPKASVMSILLLFTNRDYRQKIIGTIEDDVVKNFWTNEYAGWSEKFDSEAIMPILNKIGQFTSDTTIRNIVSQETNKIKLPDIMNSGKILLVKLPKGILGDENTSLLGSMLVTKIYQSALARSEISENQRVPFYLYIDEFQNFATDNFADILSESRKFKLSLTIANQYIAQLNDAVKKTVFGNIGSIISFRTGPEDALILENEFKPKFTATDITNLDVREIYLKMSINDETKEAFSAKTININKSKDSYKNDIIKYTRENYCSRKIEAEKEIKQEKSKELDILNKLKKQKYKAPII